MNYIAFGIVLGITLLFVFGIGYAVGSLSQLKKRLENSRYDLLCTIYANVSHSLLGIIFFGLKDLDLSPLRSSELEKLVGAMLYHTSETDDDGLMDTAKAITRFLRNLRLIGFDPVMKWFAIGQETGSVFGDKGG